MSEIIKVSTGVVFKITDVPQPVIQQIQMKANKERPKAPEQFIEAKARVEVNYDDPDYKAAMQDWELEVTQKIYDGLIMLGTEIESLPEGFPGPEDNWDEKYKVLGIEVPESGDLRYLAWVKFRAAPVFDDIMKIMTSCGRKAGVREEDVKEASELFRDNQARRTDRSL